MSVNHAAKVPYHPSPDHSKHHHVTQAPEPPPILHEGAVVGHSRALASEDGSAASREKVAEHRAAERDERDYRMPASSNVSTHFTSDISLASSSVTTYEDNGRQKVSLSSHLIHIVTSATSGLLFSHLSVCLSVCLLVG